MCAQPEKSRTGIPVLVLLAPTASGKTALAGSLFADNADSPLAGKAEIISSDSMQVYRGMNIGTAKPDDSIRLHLPHHLIDIYNPDEQFGAGDFVRLADELCRDIYSRGKLPVILGGTAFYIRNFLYGLPPTPQASPELREKIKQRLEREGSAALFSELQQVDPASASRLHLNDEYRICRALEVYYASGKPLSSFDIPLSFRQGFNFNLLYLSLPREILYQRINERVEQMFGAGLVHEFFHLIRQGYKAEDPGMQAIGYREFFMTAMDPYHPDFIEKQQREVIEMIQRDSRHYAKRQITFFNSIPGIEKADPGDVGLIERKVSNFYGIYLT